MNIAISGGGTGGGVYPALAVWRAFEALYPGSRIMWYGSKAGIERPMIEREDLPFIALDGGPVAGVGIRALWSGILIVLGTVQAWISMGRERPQALLVTGGWPTMAPAFAAWLRRIPVLIYLPDREPGGALKVLRRFARVVAVNDEAVAPHFPDLEVVISGYPLRRAVLEQAGYDELGQPVGNRDECRQAARDSFGLTDRPALLVFGGSRGARTLNLGLIEALPALLPHADVLHITGHRDAERVAGRVEEMDLSMRGHYQLFPYLHSDRMAAALAAADLVVARAGASTLGEFPIFQLPAILVPYPYAWRYQKTNADFLAERGAAIRIDDDQIAEAFSGTVLDLLKDTAGRERMSRAAAALAGPRAAVLIAEALAGMVRPDAS